VVDERRSCWIRSWTTGGVRASFDDVSMTVSVTGTGNALLRTVRRRPFSRVDVQAVLDAACAVDLPTLTLKTTIYRPYRVNCSATNSAPGRQDVSDVERLDETMSGSYRRLPPSSQTRTALDESSAIQLCHVIPRIITLHCIVSWNASTEWRTSTAKQRRRHRHRRHLRRSSLTPCLSATN